MTDVSSKRHRALWGAIVLCVGVVSGTGWLLMKLQELARERVSLEQRGSVTQGQLHTLEDQHGQLSRQYEQLVQDRDNLLSQAKRAMEEHAKLSTDRELYEGVLKRMSEEDRLLRGTLESMRADHEQLQQLADQLLQERDRLHSQVSKLESRTHEKRLKEQLAKSQETQRQQAAQAQDAKRRVSTLTNQVVKLQAELAPAQQQVKQLKEKYAKLLSDHRTLKYRASHVPKDVTTIAREHQRLLRDVADTHYNMGVLFSTKHDYTRAAKEFHKVIELQPDDGDAYYNLGVIYAEHLPDQERALAFFRKYLQFNPHAKDASWVKHYIASRQAWEAKERLE